MQSTKLFQLLKTLDVYQFNRFGKFLRSPYFNEDENLVALTDALMPHFKQGSFDNLKQRDVWKAIHGVKKFQPIKFARLFSDLLKKLEEFLVVDHLRQNMHTKQIQLIGHLAERNLGKHYPESSKIARQKLEATAYRDGEYYLQLFQLESHHLSFLELQNQRTAEKNLIQTSEALDAFYLINKLSYLAALLHYKNFLSMEGEVKLAKEVLQYLKTNDYADIPAVRIHYLVILTLIENQNEKHFHELKQKLQQHYALFPKITSRNLFAFAINYCIRKINFGKLEYVNELLSIYKQMLQGDLMTNHEGMISQFDYKNIVTVGLRAGDAKWTERFIHDYKKRIPKGDRQNAYTFNLAKFYFYQKKYDRVLPLLQEVEYSDIFYQLDSKSTLVKSYYELGEYLPLMSLKESFRILLRRKKLISEQNRNNYMNFLRLTMKLYRADVKDQKKIEALKKVIASTTNVADKGWLLEKVKELVQ